MAGIAAALILAVTAGCDSRRQRDAHGQRNHRDSQSGLCSGRGRRHRDPKWNWNLKPPLAFASKVGWGDLLRGQMMRGPRLSPEANRFRQLERILTQSQQMGYRLMVKIRVGGCSGGPEQLDPAEGTRKRPSSLPDDPAATNSSSPSGHALRPLRRQSGRSRTKSTPTTSGGSPQDPMSKQSNFRRRRDPPSRPWADIPRRGHLQHRVWHRFNCSTPATTRRPSSSASGGMTRRHDTGTALPGGRLRRWVTFPAGWRAKRPARWSPRTGAVNPVQ